MKFVCVIFSAILISQTCSIPLDKNFDLIKSILSDEKLEQLERLRRNVDFEKFSNVASFFTSSSKSTEDGVTVTCTACKSAMETARFFMAEGYSEAELIELLYTICLDMNIMTEGICSSFTKNVGPEIVVVLNTTTLQPLEVCSFLVGDSCGDVDFPGNNWEIQLPNVPKPPLQEPQFPSDSTETLRVLHLSDTHIDLKYAVGSIAECHQPLCCRNESTTTDEEIVIAGYWGGRKCDTPLWALDNFLEHASATHKDIDYIIWTGDLPSHDIWDQTRETVLEILKITASKLREAFPNVPIYPAIGNHDSAPVNSFPPPEVSGYWNMSWLYDEVWNEWGSEWLANNETSGTIRRGAFYSVQARPGLRIISMNMNFCYLNNWWLIINSTDPAQELAWLADELQKSENIGEKVHILGHVPPASSDCLNTWSTQFIKIITRYEATVAAQFYGHTHKDEFQIFYDLTNTQRPVLTSFLGPSLTTYTDLNPGYRIYDIDGDRTGSTRFVLDHETWIYDLDEANDLGTPQWKLSYKFRDAYNLSSLLPADFDALFNRLKTDSTTLNLYYKYQMKESPVAKNCNDDCAHSIFCRIRSCSIYPE